MKCELCGEECQGGFDHYHQKELCTKNLRRQLDAANDNLASANKDASDRQFRIHELTDSLSAAERARDAALARATELEKTIADNAITFLHLMWQAVAAEDRAEVAGDRVRELETRDTNGEYCHCPMCQEELLLSQDGQTMTCSCEGPNNWSITTLARFAHGLQVAAYSALQKQLADAPLATIHPGEAPASDMGKQRLVDLLTRHARPQGKHVWLHQFSDESCWPKVELSREAAEHTRKWCQELTDKTKLVEAVILPLGPLPHFDPGDLLGSQNWRAAQVNLPGVDGSQRSV